MGIVPANSTLAQAHWIWRFRKLRRGSHFPDWLLERRKRAEGALTTVVATCYLLRVSTRRMDKLVETPKDSWPWVRTLLHSVYDQSDTDSVAAQYDRGLDALSD